MALIQCPDCGKEFSDSAKQCPNCGYRLKRQNTPSENKTKQGIIICIIGVCLLILSFIFYRLSYEHWYWRFVYNDGRFQLASLFAVISIILICWAGVKLKERFHNALTYGISLCVIFIISIMVMISNCGGVMSSNQAWAEHEAYSEPDNYENLEQNQAQLEAEKARLEAEEKARLEAKEQARIEREKKEWNGASSRSDLRSKINNTIWESTTRDDITGLYYKFIIKGNSATWYSARPTRNYDDGKDWGNPIEMNLYDIYEPEEGLYVVVLKVSDETDPTGAVPYALVFDGKTVTFSRGGQKGSRMKKIG